MLTRSLFTAALALGLIKQFMLEAFTARMAALGDPVSDPTTLAGLESDVTRFRTTAWGADMGFPRGAAADAHTVVVHGGLGARSDQAIHAGGLHGQDGGAGRSCQRSHN